MTIQIDSREKPRAITEIVAHFDRAGVRHFVSKLPVGDYMSFDNPRLVIDRKQNLSELAGNVCQQHRRFVREIEMAHELGIQLVILCEHGGRVRALSDVAQWANPRLKVSPLAMSGERLYKVLATLSIKYGVVFAFCDKRATGREIVRILGGEDHAS